MEEKQEVPKRGIEQWIHSSGPGLTPYLPVLMDKLFMAVAPSAVSNTCVSGCNAAFISFQSIHTRELGTSAIGAVANACQEGLLPFFPRIIQLLRVCVLLS